MVKEGTEGWMEEKKMNILSLTLQMTEDRESFSIMVYNSAHTTFFFPTHNLYHINIDRQDYFNCPPREVFKKRNGNRSSLFLAFKGLLLGLWEPDIVCNLFFPGGG